MKKFAFLITLLVVFLSGCNISNQKLAKKIDAIGEEVKQVGTSIGNVGRLVVGKDAKEISKEKQGIGITRGMSQPIQKHIVSLQQKLERTDNISIESIFRCSFIIILHHFTSFLKNK